MARAALSRLSTLLCAVFLFTAHVFAVSSVLGVDLGTEYIKAALVKPGIPLEIVLTKDSRRKETSAVAFKPAPGGAKPGAYPERAYGSDAMALAARFPGDVYPNLKTLLGLPAESATVKEYAARHPALQLEAHKLRGTAAFKSAGAFTADEEAWLVEELLAMELQSIRTNAEALAGPGSAVRSVVLTVPPFYTMEEKRAVELAADLAGLKVLSLISDGLAVGLNYATSRQFPNINDGAKPEYHMVFDMGAGSTKATVLKFQSRTVKDVGKFNKTVQDVQVLGSGWDRTLGGDALNYLIVDDMVAQFVNSPKAQKATVTVDGVKSHGRAIAKLTKEAERLRHVLSANQNTQASFEGLYEDVDFKYKITRADFETMIAAHAERVGATVQEALKMAGLEISDLDSVILHGGASRTPFVQKELEKLVGGAEKLRTNVNSDEAAVFGAGFRAAQISPSFRVKEIQVADAAAYPAGMKWKNDDGRARHQQLWTATSHLGAVAKEVTFSNHDDFDVRFYQLVPAALAFADATAAGTVEAETKVMTTKNLTATVTELVEKYKCDKADIKFKVGVRLSGENGEVEVTKATVECQAEDPEPESFVDGVKNFLGFGKKDQQPLKGDDEEAVDLDAEASASSESAESSATTEVTSSSSSGSSSSSTTSSSPVSASTSTGASSVSAKKKHLVVIPISYTLEKAGIPQLSAADVGSLKDRIKAFEASDRARRQREESVNQLEGFTYKVRDLLTSDVFIGASTPEERAALEEKNNEASDWLYGDGADASREEIRERLKGLQSIVTPVQQRIEEESKRPELVANLKDQLDRTRTFVANMKKQITEYESLQSSVIASLASSATISTDTTAADTSATVAPAAGDFADLEDDDFTSSTTTTTTRSHEMEDALRESGAVPPLYTAEDLQENEALCVSISAWLEEKLAEQAKLGPRDDAVLTIKDLEERRKTLEDAGMALAVRSARNFESRQKKSKGSSSSPSSKTKKAKPSKTKSGEPAAKTVKVDPGREGGMPSDEELEEMIRRFAETRPTDGEGKEDADADADADAAGGRKHEEL